MRRRGRCGHATCSSGPLAAIAMIVASVSATSAQSGSTKTGLSGTVIDTGGGVLPGATVEVKNNRTGVDDHGRDQLRPAPSTCRRSTPGIYTITVSLSGFKTVVLTDVELLSGDAALVEGHARSRRDDRVGRSPRRQPARADAGDDGLVDDPRRPDLEPAAHHAQRAELRRVPARRRHVGVATTRSGRRR